MPYHPMSLAAWKSLVMAGVAVEMMSLSYDLVSSWEVERRALCSTHQGNQEHANEDGYHQEHKLYPRRIDFSCRLLLWSIFELRQRFWRRLW